MDFILNNGVLTIKIGNRIDSTNANEVDGEIEKIVSANEHSALIFDFGNTDYVSSAGLRIVLKFKKLNASFKVINTNVEVYDVFEMTGFTEIMDIEKAYKEYSVEGLPVIGVGAKGTVYRYNEDTVIKVFNRTDVLDSIKREKELARKAFVLGVPTAISYDIVKVGDKFGSVYELLDSKTITNCLIDDPERIDYYAEQFSSILKTFHESVVKPNELPDAKNIAYSWIQIDKDYLPENIYNKVKQMIDDIPYDTHLAHMDYHTGNVMMQNNEFLVIDMDTLSEGKVIFDLANVYCTYEGFSIIDKKVIEDYLGFDIEKSMKFYHLFLNHYFNGENKEASDKVKLLGLLRVLGHLIKRQTKYENFEERKNCIINEISNLLDSINDFNIGD